MEKHKYNIFPEMDNEDYQRLLNDIDINGYDKTQPIYLYEGNIIDGWNRQKACSELDIMPIYENFIGSEIQAIEFVMRTNKRRNLTSSQWACIAVESDEIISVIKADAKERQGKRTDLNNNIRELIPESNKRKDETRSSQKTADLFNTNEKYIRDAEKYKDENPELFNEIKSGEKTITQAKREIKKAEVIKKLTDIENVKAKEVDGVYDVIVIDPPWPMKKIDRDVSPEQVEFDYPVMSVEDIGKIKIPSAEDCHLFLWTTQKFLPTAFSILDEWGFKYVCCFVWHKNGGFQPFGMPQYNCEFVLYARKGKAEFIEFKDFPTCFSANRTGHSEKPERFYEILRRVTAGRRLDMFNRRDIDGFDKWGNEA